MIDKRDLRDLALVSSTRLAMSAVVLAGGFRAVSDDDFARIVHAQEFALSPALDPTGTSWLPFPFWLGGGVMMVFGTSVTVARATAIGLGLISSLVLFAAARLLVADRRGALVGALAASVFPWSARLGVATVPELFAASLSVFALATLAARRTELRLYGALCLAVATLCRYEPWLLAGAFAVYSVIDAARDEDRRGRLLAGAGLAIAGPVAWVVHNALWHGDALHFLARVSAYKKAVGGVPAGVWSLVEGYPLSLLREEPELCLVAIALSSAARTVPVAFRRPAVSLAVMIAMLSAASIRGGAPTHHVGRAVLAVWLLLAIGVGEGARVALASPKRAHFAGLVLVVMPLGAFVLRPWYARLDSFITREHEIAIGRVVAPHLTGALALVEARDYGFFAVQAGSGAPRRLLLDRSLDPRGAVRSSSFTSAAAIRRRAEALGATVVLGHLTPATQELGAPLATRGPWGAWIVTPARNAPPHPR